MTMHAGSERSLYGVYGAGGCGRGVLPVANAMLKSRHASDEFEVVFIDDNPSIGEMNGRRVLTLDPFDSVDAKRKFVSLAVADPAVRRDLDARCRNHGLNSFAVTATNVVIMDDVEIGEGAILSPFVTITSNVRIGRHFQANLYSYVEHDCRIGDFVTFAPGVLCNGNVAIGNHVYLGAGCILRQGIQDSPLEIGEGAVVGMGAVVTKSVAPGVTVVGNPAKPIERGKSAC